MSKEKKSGFGKGVIFGILLAALLAGGFFWFTNRAEKNKAEVEKGKTEKDENQRAHYTFLAAQIQRYLDKSTIDHLTAPAETPLGPPI